MSGAGVRTMTASREVPERDRLIAAMEKRRLGPGQGRAHARI